MLVKDFEDKVLRRTLNMTQPDVMATLNGRALILISSEEGETEENMDKCLSKLGIKDGTVLAVEDFLQDLKLQVVINHW